MKFAFRYLMDHRKLIGIQLLFAGIFAAAFYLYHLPAAAVLYPIWICFLLSIWLCVSGMFCLSGGQEA